jgi:iron(III) transport system permease protein
VQPCQWPASGAETGRHRLDLSRRLFFLLAAALAVLVLLPLFWLVFVDKKGTSTFANYAILAMDPTMGRAFLIALSMAVCVGVLSYIVATPLAWLVARTDLPARQLTRILVTASVVTPPFLGAIAWEMLAAPNSGIINEIYRWMLGLDRSHHLLNIFTFSGLIFAIACYSFPYVLTLVANALDKVPGDLEEASAILGARPSMTLFRVTSPMVLPAMLAGSLVAIVQALR